MSFWSEPYINQKHNKWINEDSWNLSWLLSVSAITKLYGKPHLYTDSPGAKFLSDNLGLEFASINTSLDDLAGKDPRFFSLGRTYAISMQTEPFIHVDYDTYLFEKIPEELFQSGVLFHKTVPIVMDKALPQRVSSFYRPDLFDSVNGLPSCWKKQISEHKTQCYQSCIVGGSNIDYFKEYTQSILDVVNSNNKDVWTDIDNNAKEVKPTIGFVPQYTLDGYMAFAVAKNKNITPKFIVNEYNIDMIKFGHIGNDKSRYGDVYGRIVRRLVTDFPEQNGKTEKLSSNSNLHVPKISVIIISKDSNKSIYDSVLRVIVPRRISPDEVIIPDFNINENDRKLLTKLDGIRFIPGGNSYEEALSNAYKRSSGQLFIVIDGNVKMPKLYIEKTIAANLEYPHVVLAMASTGFGNKRGTVCYSNKFNLKNSEDNILDMPVVSELVGGAYVFPRFILEYVVRSKPESIEKASSFLLEKKYEIRCLKGVLVSNNFQTNI